jgi:hypothetical protein
MPRSVRRPKPLRAALVAAAVLVAAHVGARDVVEGLRLRLLGALVAPAAALRGAVRSEAPLRDALAAVASRRETRTGLFSAVGAAALPIVDYRPREGVLVLGAGREAGVVFGAAVYAREGLLGHVERVETHLARVRLVAARGARTAVVAERVATDLPGGIERLAAVAEGDGVAARLAEGALLESFRPGDRLAAFGPRAYAFGTVAEAGPRPLLKLSADAANAGAAAAEGVETGAPIPGLFESEPMRVAAEPAVGGRGAVLIGSGGERLTVGAAVERGGVYLGRVVRTAGDVAYAERADDPGHEVGVRLIGAAGETGATLRSEGGGVFRVVAGGPDAADADEFDAFTAGGGGLVPADLYVGRLVAARGRLYGTPPGPWTRAVDVAVFVFDAERRRLTEGGPR